MPSWRAIEQMRPRASNTARLVLSTYTANEWVCNAVGGAAGGAAGFPQLIGALTTRKLEVLALVIKGLNGRQIEEPLYLATG